MPSKKILSEKSKACSLLSDEMLNIVKRLIDNNTTIDYVFMNDTSSKYKKSDFMIKNVKDVEFVKRPIYLDDSISTISDKIANSMKVQKDEIFIFSKILLTKINATHIIQKFLNSVFLNKRRVTITHLNQSFKITFDLHKERSIFEKDSDNISISYEDAISLFDEKTVENIQYYLVPISFDLLDANNIPILFAINPYKYIMADVKHKKQTFRSTNNSRDIGSFRNHSFETLDSNDEDDMQLFVVLKSDITQYNEDHHKIQTDKVLELYFDKETNANIINKTFIVVDEIDAFKTELNLFPYNDFVSKLECNLLNVKILTSSFMRSLPDREDKRKTLLNLNKIFNLLHVNEHIPFVSYKSSEGEYLYRVLKNGLSKIVPQERFRKWIQNEEKFVKQRTSGFLSIRAIIENVIFTVSIRENGNCEVIGSFSRTTNTDIKNMGKYVDLLNDLVLSKIYEITRNDINIVNPITIGVNSSILEFKTVSSVTTKSKLISKDVLRTNLENNAFFTLFKETNDDMFLNYKRVSNYSNMDRVTSFITRNYNLEETVLIQNLMNEFNFEKDVAEKEWNERKNDIKLQLLNENGNVVYKAKYNDGAYVKLRKLNDFQYEVVINNIDRLDYHINIIKILSMMFHDKKVKFKLSKKSQNIISENTDIDELGVFNLGKMNDMKEKNKERSVDSDQDETDSIVSADSMSETNSIVSADSMDDISEASPAKGEDNSVFEDELETNIEEELETNIEEELEINDEPELYIKTDEELHKDAIKMAKEFEQVGKDKKLMKQYHSRFINKKLKDADKDLFVTGFAKHCGAVDKKQPVVVSKQELMHINLDRRDSYTGYLKTGSTDILEKQNHYICPLIWCPISKVSLTPGELEANDNKCPKPLEETPLILHNKKINKISDLKDIQKYPYFMNANLHPEQKKMVCCGYKSNPGVIYNDDEDTQMDKEDIDTEIEKNKEINSNADYNQDRYIRKLVGIPVEDNRLATLPPFLNNFLNKGKTLDECSGLRTDSKNGCFVRLGLGLSVKQKFLNSLVKTLGNSSIKSVKDLVELVNSELKLQEYLFLNNGNTMKTFVPKYMEEDQLYQEYREFLKSVRGKKYVEIMNLEIINDFVKKHKKLPNVNEHTIMFNLIKRELLIFSSYQNFKKYILDTDIEKDISETFDLTSFYWLNPYSYQYIVIDVSDEDNVSILCEKYRIPEMESNKLIFLLKNTLMFEQLIQIKNGGLDILKAPFNKNDIVVKDLLDIYATNCVYLNETRPVYGSVVFLKLKELITKGRLCSDDDDCTVSVVINYNIKIVGFFIKTYGVYIPLEFEEGFSKFFLDELCCYPQFVTYIDNLQINEFTGSSTSTKEAFNIIMKELSPIIPFYKNNSHNMFVDDLNTLTNNDDLYFFTGYEIDDQRKIFMRSYNKNNVQLITIKKELFITLNSTENNLKLKRRLELIRHEYNPYSYQDKLKQTRIIIKSLLDKSIDEELVELISNDIYIKGLNVSEKKVYSEPVIDESKEVIFELRDLISGKLLDHYLLSINPYKNLRNSAEDLVVTLELKEVHHNIIEKNEETNENIFTKLIPTILYVDKLLNINDHGYMYKQDASTKEILLNTFKTINFEYFKDKKIELSEEYMNVKFLYQIQNRYSSVSQKKQIRSWLNLLDQNTVMTSASVTQLKNKKVFAINNREELGQAIVSDRYAWGIMELTFMCQKYGIGLILISKTRNSKTKIDMKIRNNVEMILPDDNNIEDYKYLLVYANKKIKHPIQPIVSINETDKSYNKLLRNWNELPDKLKNTLSGRTNRTDDIIDLTNVLLR
jgi:hypothetical protein